MESSNIKLLWGTANAFHKRYIVASTNPDPEVFAYKAAQVNCMDATKRLGGVIMFFGVVGKDRNNS